MSRNAAGDGDAALRNERVFTAPLVMFLLAVAAIMLFAARERFRTPDLDEAILLLADGDLDGEERARMLQIVVAAAQHRDEPRDRWAGLLASVPLGDRAGHAALWAKLGSGPVPTTLPGPPDRELLHLGDPMLGNLLKAMVAEVENRKEDALVAWRQVAAQSRLTGSAFAAELAALAIERLR